MRCRGLPVANETGFAEFEQPGATPKITSIFDFTAEALGQLRLWLEQNPPAIPITSILGFSQFAAQHDSVAAQESTTSTSYTNLTTVGPRLENLPDGKYVILFGCASGSTLDATEPRMSVKINSTEAVDADGGVTSLARWAGQSSAVIKTLSNGGNNTILCRYRTDTNTGQFRHRWLVAIRIGNL